MRIPTRLLLAMTMIITCSYCSAQDSRTSRKDTLEFSGQAAFWGSINTSGDNPRAQLGLRYIPNIYYGIRLSNSRLIDSEWSVNMFAYHNPLPADESSTHYDLDPYRAWIRYSTEQWEFRLGLQKINFGSATLLRPLMWFDQVDPRDPLKLSSGVWGLLARHYFLNNANLWGWCLYGNTGVRTWDIGPANKRIPEFGGRYQHPLPWGEMALTYHHRVSDTRDYSDLITEYAEIPENRIGIDAKLDLGVGFSFEGAWINKSKDLGPFTNQEIINLGFDYTFGLGNGINLMFEQVCFANDTTAFDFYDPLFFSALSISYPLGIVDNLSAIVFYDWTSNNSYNFLSWNHRFKHISMFLMAFLNPNEYKLPQQGGDSNYFAGRGLQLILVYNH